MTHPPSHRQFLETAAAGMALGMGMMTVSGGAAVAATAAQGDCPDERLFLPLARLPHRRPVPRRLRCLSRGHRGDNVLWRTPQAPLRDCQPVYRADARGHRPGPGQGKEAWRRQSPTIADALTLGSGKLVVDAVPLITEYGDYPLNAKLQKLYPRGHYFREVLDVVHASGRAVPVFIDKHLSYSRAEAQRMVDQARALNVPLMAGSSLPVTWLPPLGRTITDVLVASRGNLEIFGFHALETLQCMAERRDRKGKPQGVKSVTYPEGDAVWRAADQGVWSWELLRHALGRSHTVNPGDIKQNTRDFAAPATRDAATILDRPVAFVVDYADGLRATALILNGHIDDITVAVRLNDPSSPGPGRDRDTIVSTLMYLPAPPGRQLLRPLGAADRGFLQDRQGPLPVERTLLAGILDAALDSRVQHHQPVATPELATVDYTAPADSGFIRAPLTEPTLNRLGH